MKKRSTLKKNQSYPVLLIAEDKKELELYTELIHDVVDCPVDTMSSPRDILDLSYPLIVVAKSAPGLEILEQIKRATPSTGVIIISANPTIEEAVAAIRLGAEDYLSKPFKLESFQLAVKRCLDKKNLYSENTDVSQFLYLSSICQLISASLEQKKIFEIVQNYLLRELNAGVSAVYFLRGEEPVRIDSHEKAESQDRALEEVLNLALRSTNPLARMSNPTEFFRFIEKGQLTPSMFVLKFKCTGEKDYFAVCLSPQRPNSLEAFESRLKLLKAQIEVTGKNIEKYKGVQELAYLDDATGLYNTRYLNTILDREIFTSENTQKPFAVLFIDADKFKRINDTYGHLVGTKLLNELGHHLKSLVGEKDTVFRYGGDEFVAVLSDCGLEKAGIVGERIRESVQNKVFLDSEGLQIHFTVSIGIALFPTHAKTKKAIIEAADQAMYAAKRKTRNCVFISTQVNPGMKTGER